MTENFFCNRENFELLKENKALMNHVAELQQKIFELQFQLDQSIKGLEATKKFDVRFASPIFIIKGLWERCFRIKR